jgi:hypothetical protein
MDASMPTPASAHAQLAPPDTNVPADAEALDASGEARSRLREACMATRRRARMLALTQPGGQVFKVTVEYVDASGNTRYRPMCYTRVDATSVEGITALEGGASIESADQTQTDNGYAREEAELLGVPPVVFKQGLRIYKTTDWAMSSTEPHKRALEADEADEADEAGSGPDDSRAVSVRMRGAAEDAIAPVVDAQKVATVADVEAVLEAEADAPTVHCRNASVLAGKHPFPADAHCVFEEEGHKYTIFGKPVERSTTRVLGDFFGAFDPVACTDQFFDGWAKNARSQYHEQIQRLRAEGFADDEIAARIRGDWTRLGEEASRLGTLLHLTCEYDCNGEPLPDGTDVSEIPTEVEQYECFKASAFYRNLGLTPFRTELTVAWRVGEMNVCAGQIDALYVDKDGHYYIVDFKRVVAKHVLSPDEQGFRGAMGLGPAAHLADTHFQKYSLQTSIYNIMLHQTHGVDAGQNMYLLRMHDDREAYELVKCADHREVARKVLAIEHARLVAEEAA